MSTLGFILLFTFIGSIGSLLGGLVILSHKKTALKVSHYLASFAAGTLLGSAFFDLLPEAAHEAEESGIDVFMWTLIGLTSFFILERFIHWFHHHEEHHQHSKESKSTLPLIIIGDAVHNFIDGIVIGATFLINIPLGIVTTFAVAAHEIPQEIGDFGLMLHKGMSRKTVIMVNILSAATAFIGALLSFSLGSFFEAYIPMFLAITAGFFIYIASSDIIPEIHHESNKKIALLQSILLLCGIISVWGVLSTFDHLH